MMFMSDQEAALRIAALERATYIAGSMEAPETTVKRAKAFYAFLSVSEAEA